MFKCLFLWRADDDPKVIAKQQKKKEEEEKKLAAAAKKAELKAITEKEQQEMAKISKTKADPKVTRAMIEQQRREEEAERKR